MMRPLRRSAAAKAPHWWIAPPLEAWFRGERNRPLSALIVPFHGQLDDLWQAWAEVHPDAVKPQDWPERASEAECKASRRALSRKQPRWYGAESPPRDIGKT